MMGRLLFSAGRICNPSSCRTDCKSVLRRDRPGARLLALYLCITLAAAGCARAEAPAQKAAEPTPVHAVRPQLRTIKRIDDGEWIEVTNRRLAESWVPIDRSEQVLLGDLSGLEEGEAVRLAEGSEEAVRATK
jgi:hypothetical protein